MRPETAERIRKAINDLDGAPLDRMPFFGPGTNDLHELTDSVTILTTIAHAFLSTYVPPVESVAESMSYDEHIADIIAHCARLSISR